MRAVKVLLNLYETRNTYLTAEQLNLSQSAVARTLAKCRNSFDDPLYIRSSNQLSPTALMESLVEKLPSLIEQFEKIIDDNSEFYPERLTGCYQIYLNRHTQLAYGEKLFDFLSEQAPSATWYIKGWESNATEQLLDGRATIGVNYYSEALPNSICQDILFRDEFALYADRDHPLHHCDTVSVEDLEKYEFVSLAIPSLDERSEYIDYGLQSLGVNPTIRLQTDSILLAMKMAKKRSAILPASMATVIDKKHNFKPISFGLGG